jgi:type III secretion protein V
MPPANNAVAPAATKTIFLFIAIPLLLVPRYTRSPPEVTFGDDLPTFVRRSLADLIGNVAARGTGTLVAYLLDPRLEDELAACTDRVEPVPVGLAEDIRNAFYREVSKLLPTAALPALLTTDKCRALAREILCVEFPLVRVLGYKDLPAHLNIQPIARISR